jgi:hypothetical protein
MVDFDFFHKKCGGRKANDLATDSWCARKRFVNMTKTSDRRTGEHMKIRLGTSHGKEDGQMNDE